MTSSSDPATTQRSTPGGHQMHREMAEQPRVLADLADRLPELRTDGMLPSGDRIPGVAFLARGSSDHAALLGRYAVELYSGLPTCLIAPSISTAHARPPARFAGWLVIALSQSGQTPEIVQLAGEFRHHRATVVAISNDDDSDLAKAADVHIGLRAGPETAVPATKTVTAQMLAVLAIASQLGNGGLTDDQAAAIPDAVRNVLADETPVSQLANDLLTTDRLALVGRGACYPAALETALKLQETTGMMAHGFSTADFRHGPIAVCGPQTPALLLAGSGPADADTRTLVAELARRSAAATIIGTGAHARISWPSLGSAAECLLATVRGQQLAHALCLGRGIDPDRPSGLSKVTLTH